MDLRLKGGFISLVVATALYFAFPSYQAYFEASHPESVSGKINLGLDLQGGMYLDLAVDLDQALHDLMQETANDLEDALLEQGAGYLGVDVETNKIYVELEENEQVDFTKAPYERILQNYDSTQNNSILEFSLTAERENRFRTETVDQTLEVLRNRIDGLGVSEPSIQKQGENSIVIQLPGVTDRTRAIAAIGMQAVLKFHLVHENATARTRDKSSTILRYEELVNPQTGQVISKTPIVLKRIPEMGGEFVNDAQVMFDQNNNTPYVSIQFNSAGADKFAKLTQKHVGKRLAIVLDGKIRSSPVIREAIAGGQASISGSFTIKEASDLALVLRSGSLKAPIQILEEQTVGASLGEDSVQDGFTSLLLGCALVIVMMVGYYRMSGIFANVSLSLNILLILSILSALEATLTLPGVAGIVLTIGMAVDANVLIFERIREELSAKVHPREAVTEGFAKAFSAILDANLTTLFSALVLMQFGSGPIKGFAITLATGILVSMFTAIFVTRFLFEVVYLRRRRIQSISLGLKWIASQISIDFLSKQKIAAVFSISVLFAGLVSVIAKGGLKYGVDFRGGANIQIQLAESPDLETLRQQLSHGKIGSFSLQRYGEDENREVLISVPVDSDLIQVQQGLGPSDDLTARLQKILPNTNFEIRRVEMIGPRVGENLKKSAVYAILITLTLILAYISLRFHWNFGFSSIITLSHDVLFILAMFSFFDFEISLSIVASVLTVIGYSLNDTIVVFDRIRENLGRYRNRPLLQIINQSLNEVLGRTMLTSVTTLLVVMALFFFGGEILRQFSAALLIGVLVGTYSSIYIASPLLLFQNKVFQTSLQTEEEEQS